MTKRKPVKTSYQGANIMRRVRALEAEQKRQGESLVTLLKSDEMRTQRERIIVFFITRVIPGSIAVAVPLATALSWLVSHFH